MLKESEIRIYRSEEFRTEFCRNGSEFFRNPIPIVHVFCEIPFRTIADVRSIRLDMRSKGQKPFAYVSKYDLIGMEVSPSSTMRNVLILETHDTEIRDSDESIRNRPRTFHNAEPAIRAHEKDGNAAEYDSELKTACGDFRIMTEQSNERVMMNGLMERFRRSMHTKHLLSLTKVNADDCALADSMMTKHSKFEHSQSDELAGVLPSPDELAADLDTMIAWIDEFEKGDA